MTPLKKPPHRTFLPPLVNPIGCKAKEMGLHHSRECSHFAFAPWGTMPTVSWFTLAGVAPRHTYVLVSRAERVLLQLEIL